MRIVWAGQDGDDGDVYDFTLVLAQIEECLLAVQKAAGIDVGLSVQPQACLEVYIRRRGIREEDGPELDALRYLIAARETLRRGRAVINGYSHGGDVHTLAIGPDVAAAPEYGVEPDPYFDNDCASARQLFTLAAQMTREVPTLGLPASDT
ncbi:hypothetical protein [Aquipuribacter nitratireducens]|uniref:Uncharacterized protein n=1 Tax=Aquipuribacter nitratireducens TaxID=650104 RepID=A0ABW0GIZ7_9MICO